MAALYDEVTLQIYKAQAQRFASLPVSNRSKIYLKTFIDKLSPGASVLDLGCGSGWAAGVLARNGFDVYALDAVPELAAMASARLSRPATAIRFDQLDAPEMFDAIFACDALHYVPRESIPYVLGAVSQTLRPGGLLFASFKQGQGDYRDNAGRFYSCYQVDGLMSIFNGSAGLMFSSLKTDASADLSGEHRIFLGVHCRRAVQVWQ